MIECGTKNLMVAAEDFPDQKKILLLASYQQDPQSGMPELGGGGHEIICSCSLFPIGRFLSAVRPDDKPYNH